MSITIAFPVGYRPVLKHGEHDQSSHGSWATGNFNEETEGEGAQGNYFERYGFDTKTGEPTGVSIEGVRALDFYTGDGYENINSFLRGKGDTGTGSLTAIQKIVSDMDKVIEESPDMFGDKNLYRVFSTGVLSSLDKGDILSDKGYLSTTRVDITSKEGLEVLQNLQLIRETDDKAAVILPSESKSGRGVAVDYLKNAISDKFTNVATANNEKEVLLPRNTSLKFMGYQKVNAGTDNAMEVAVFQRMDG